MRDHRHRLFDSRSVDCRLRIRQKWSAVVFTEWISTWKKWRIEWQKKFVFPTRDCLSCVQRITFECIFSLVGFPVVATVFQRKGKKIHERRPFISWFRETSTMLFHTLLMCSQVPSYATVSFSQNFLRRNDEYGSYMNSENSHFNNSEF